MWQCPRCETRNEDNRTNCVVCGTSKSMLHHQHESTMETERQGNRLVPPAMQNSAKLQANPYSYVNNNEASHESHRVFAPLPDGPKPATRRSSRYGKRIAMSISAAFLLVLLYFGFSNSIQVLDSIPWLASAASSSPTSTMPPIPTSKPTSKATPTPTPKATSKATPTPTPKATSTPTPTPNTEDGYDDYICENTEKGFAYVRCKNAEDRFDDYICKNIWDGLDGYYCENTGDVKESTYTDTEDGFTEYICTNTAR